MRVSLHPRVPQRARGGVCADVQESATGVEQSRFHGAAAAARLSHVLDAQRVSVELHETCAAVALFVGSLSGPACSGGVRSGTSSIPVEGFEERFVRWAALSTVPDQ